jgi:hypothetical protein
MQCGVLLLMFLFVFEWYSIQISPCVRIQVFWNAHYAVWWVVHMFQRMLQNVGKNLPNQTVWLLRRLESSTTPLWEPQISFLICLCFPELHVVSFVSGSVYDIVPICSSGTRNQQQIYGFVPSNSLAVEVPWQSLRLYRDTTLYDISHYYFNRTISCNGMQHTSHCYFTVPLFSCHAF